jgi:hypothetical protein
VSSRSRSMLWSRAAVQASVAVQRASSMRSKASLSSSRTRNSGEEVMALTLIIRERNGAPNEKEIQAEIVYVISTHQLKLWEAGAIVSDCSAALQHSVYSLRSAA